jgi:hypothetical protein
MLFIFETVHTHLTLQEDAACCIVTDVEVRRTHEGKIQAVDVKKTRLCTKKNHSVLMQGRSRRG